MRCVYSRSITCSSFSSRVADDSDSQYKVFLFDRILLCCKEMNPNKSKNKMLGNKSAFDKKGKPKLQLKGRIFMQNVTDVLTIIKPGEFDDVKRPFIV